MSFEDQLDVGELLDGFAIGKAVKLADWRHRKEEAEFRKLCKRIRASNRQRAIYAEGGERLAAYTARQLAWARAKTLKLHRANPRVYTCRECGNEWCLIRPRNGSHPTLCSPECKRAETARRALEHQRAIYTEGGERLDELRRRKRDWARKKKAKTRKRCSVCRKRGHNRRTCPTTGS